MYIYIGLYAYLIIKSFTRRKNVFTDILVILIFILGFGYCVGVDWIAYQYYYDILLAKINFLDIFNLNDRIEKGYLILNYFGRILKLNYESFMGILLSVNLYYFLKFIKSKTTNVSLSIVFMLSTFLFGLIAEPGIRQFSVLVLGIYATDYLSDKKKIKYILMIILGIFIHNSILILPIVHFFYYKCIRKINLSLMKVIFFFLIIFVLIRNISQTETSSR